MNKLRVDHATEKSHLTCEIDLMSQRIQDMESRSSKFRKEVDCLQSELRSTGSLHHQQMSVVQNENAQLLKQMESAQSDLIERLKVNEILHFLESINFIIINPCLIAGNTKSIEW